MCFFKVSTFIGHWTIPFTHRTRATAVGRSTSGILQYKSGSGLQKLFFGAYPKPRWRSEASRSQLCSSWIGKIAFAAWGASFDPFRARRLNFSLPPSSAISLKPRSLTPPSLFLPLSFSLLYFLLSPVSHFSGVDWHSWSS